MWKKIKKLYKKLANFEIDEEKLEKAKKHFYQNYNVVQKRPA